MVVAACTLGSSKKVFISRPFLIIKSHFDNKSQLNNKIPI
jgi:hypothetical protein